MMSELLRLYFVHLTCHRSSLINNCRNTQVGRRKGQNRGKDEKGQREEEKERVN